ncbi:uncharacterized protein PAC_14420 [Phialocephala subalpina]|uniref:Uncharacterized protein n=1 Tax=Phialocephala subalpina TaxID=576137 RepID=A0A1L7XHL6_9HELO|nr:uncharacterized protein PAC_14420 [Phialocephala subalpina]
MLISTAVTAPGRVLRDAASSATVSSVITLDDLQQQANTNTLAALDKRHKEFIKQGQKSTCNSKTVVIRKEYGNLSAQEKMDYINVVLCLQGKMALTPTSLVPGARSRYDDFVATHINQTLIIHYTATSLSGNGAYIPGRNDTVLTAVTPSGPVAPLRLTPGLGGGCISAGPFGNLTVSLGPLGNPNAAPGPDGGLGYNPRCLKRDINPTTAQRFNNLT